MGIPAAALAVLAVLAAAAAAAAGAGPVSAARSVVWGSGVVAGADTPARYVYVQLADAAGRNLTASPGAVCGPAVLSRPLHVSLIADNTRSPPLTLNMPRDRGCR